MKIILYLKIYKLNKLLSKFKENKLNDSNKIWYYKNINKNYKFRII